MAQWWRGGATVGRWTCDQEVVSSIPGSGRSCVTTVGKSITPACLDADSLRYYMESLNRVPLTFNGTVTCKTVVTAKIYEGCHILHRSSVISLCSASARRWINYLCLCYIFA